MAGQTVFEALASVRARLWRVRMLRDAATGLLAAAGLLLILGLTRVLGGIDLGLGLSITILLLGPVLGALVSLARRPTWELAAACIDSFYGLKDRATTAVAFLGRPSTTNWESLQIEDAAKHLLQVDAKKVLPIPWPRNVVYGLIVSTLAVALVVWPLAAPPLQAAPVGPNEGLLALAADLDEDLDDIEKEAEERQDEELKKLVKQLREQTEALKEEGIEQKEALATLSEMQAALAQHAQYNAAVVNAQLSNLAEAMSSAEALQPTAEKLAAGDHKGAADELEKLENADASHRGERAAAERMNKLASEMNGKGLPKMGGSISQMADGMSTSNSSKFCEGCKSLANQLRKHDSNCKMSFCLLRQVDKLSECKGQCSMCFGNCQGDKPCSGDGQCEKNSMAEGLKPKESTKPSTNFGKTTSGNLFGEKTDLASNGKREQITGQAGEGPSEIETTTSPEGRELAGRAYKERYEKYRKLSEEVLDGEPIPLGHRQMIRQYFELIRPTAAESAQIDAEPLTP